MNYLHYRNNAIYEKNLKKLEKELKFKRYWKDDDALKDIINLINEYGENGVCILDPYLESKDILNTLIHLKFYNAKIRANQVRKLLFVKYICFYILGFVSLLIFGYYLAAFGSFYQNTQYILIKNVIISYIISLIFIMNMPA